MVHSSPVTPEEEQNEVRQPLLSSQSNGQDTPESRPETERGAIEDPAQQASQASGPVSQAPQPPAPAPQQPQQPHETVLQAPVAPSPPSLQQEPTQPHGATTWTGTWPPAQDISGQIEALRMLAAAMGGLPSLTNQWAALRPFLACWMVSSVVNAVIFMMADGATTAFLFAEIASIIGVVAGARATIPSCRQGVDVMTLCKQLHVMGALATLMDMFTLFVTDAVLLALAFNCPEGQEQMCEMARPAAAFFTLVLASHGVLSAHVARSAFQIVRTINPVTSGHLSLDD